MSINVCISYSYRRRSQNSSDIQRHLWQTKHSSQTQLNAHTRVVMISNHWLSLTEKRNIWKVDDYQLVMSITIKRYWYASYAKQMHTNRYCAKIIFLRMTVVDTRKGSLPYSSYELHCLRFVVETFSMSLVFWEGDQKGPVSLDVNAFIHIRLDKRLSKQWSCRWLDTPWGSVDVAVILVWLPTPQQDCTWSSLYENDVYIYQLFQREIHRWPVKGAVINAIYPAKVGLQVLWDPLK